MTQLMSLYTSEWKQIPNMTRYCYFFHLGRYLGYIGRYLRFLRPLGGVRNQQIAMQALIKVRMAISTKQRGMEGIHSFLFRSLVLPYHF